MILKLERVTTDHSEGGNKHVFTNGHHNYYVVSSTSLDPGKYYEIDLHECQDVRVNRYYIDDIKLISNEIEAALELMIDEALELLGHEEILKLPFHESMEKVNKIANALHESKIACSKIRQLELYKEAYEIFMNRVCEITPKERKRIIDIARKIEEETWMK